MAINFTIEDIKAAYAATGLKPTRKKWLGKWRKIAGEQCDQYAYGSSCPLGALLTKRCGKASLVKKAIAEEGDSEDDYLDYLEEASFNDLAEKKLGMTLDEVSGFIAGVDGNPRNYWNTDAYNLGVEVREALFAQIDEE